MTLIPDIDLRNATIPIFFDMMQGYVFSGYLILLYSTPGTGMWKWGHV